MSIIFFFSSSTHRLQVARCCPWHSELRCLPWCHYLLRRTAESRREVPVSAHFLDPHPWREGRAAKPHVLWFPPKPTQSRHGWVTKPHHLDRKQVLRYSTGICHEFSFCLLLSFNETAFKSIHTFCLRAKTRAVNKCILHHATCAIAGASCPDVRVIASCPSSLECSSKEIYFIISFLTYIFFSPPDSPLQQKCVRPRKLRFFRRAQQFHSVNAVRKDIRRWGAVLYFPTESAFSTDPNLT